MNILSRYAPLIALAALAVLGAGALAVQGLPWMAGFMGLGLFIFAFVKLANWPGFVEGFRKYDLIAGALPAYAWLYPLLELALAMAYLAGAPAVPTNLAMLVVAILNIASVTVALLRGVNTMCACMGTSLNVLLTTVTLVENTVMGAMALAMLLY